MTGPEEPPAAITFLLGLSRARHALQRARSLPGLPLLTIGRRVRAAGGARGPDGELPWAAGAIPAFQRDDQPAPPSPALSRTASSWPHVRQEHHTSVAAPATPAAAIRLSERPAGTRPADAVSAPHRSASERAPPPAERHLDKRPPLLVSRSVAVPGATPEQPPPRAPLPPEPAALPVRTALPIATRSPANRAFPPSIPPAASPTPETPATIRAAPNLPPAPAAPPPLPQPAARLSARSRPTTPQRAKPAGPALPWPERHSPSPEPSALPAPALAGPAHSPAPIPAPATTPALLQHATHATPASVSTVMALGEGIQHAVRRELDEIRAIVTRVGQQAAPPPPAVPPPPPAATGDAARHLLGRMRTILQEEQFRRGNIR